MERRKERRIDTDSLLLHLAARCRLIALYFLHRSLNLLTIPSSLVFLLWPSVVLLVRRQNTTLKLVLLHSFCLLYPPHTMLVIRENTSVEKNLYFSPQSLWILFLKAHQASRSPGSEKWIIFTYWTIGEWFLVSDLRFNLSNFWK